MLGTLFAHGSRERSVCYDVISKCVTECTLKYWVWSVVGLVYCHFGAVLGCQSLAK
jgi:hypothetical protein